MEPLSRDALHFLHSEAKKKEAHAKIECVLEDIYRAVKDRATKGCAIYHYQIPLSGSGYGAISPFYVEYMDTILMRLRLLFPQCLVAVKRLACKKGVMCEPDMSTNALDYIEIDWY
jgi:hypothetical protein